jgi:membrane protein
MNSPSSQRDLPRICWGILQESAASWNAHKAPKMGAALAYYTAFSLAPLIILMLSMVSLFMKRSEASREIVAQISDLVGAQGGAVVQEILSHAGSTSALSWSTGLSFLVLLVSASGAFGELQDSLNTIWEVPPQKHPWRSMLKSRLLSLSMVLVLGFFMITSLILSTFTAGLSSTWAGALPKAGLELVNTVFSTVIIGGLFATIFRILPDAQVTWEDVIPGALISAGLFVVGKTLLGLYIAHSAFASSYGAAASFIVILFWVFYSAQILYFGAEVTRAFARRLGSRRHDKKDAATPLKSRVRNKTAPHGQGAS